MADQDDEYDDNDDTSTEDQNPSQVTLNRRQLRSLERNAKGKADAEQRAADLERRLAFAEAGIKPSDPRMSYFVKGYDGELTADAITKAATEAGFLTPPVADNDADTRQELAAHERVSAASAGTTSRPDDALAKLKDVASSGDRSALLAEIARHRSVVTG